MPNFTKRSNQKELLDRDDIPFEDIRQNMSELDRINTLLGGHAITIAGLKKILTHKKTIGPILICEIGCGGGDNLRVIQEWCKQNNEEAILMGVDINPHCISYAQSRKENAGIDFVCSNYKDVVFKEKPAIIFSSLFCHHLNHNEFLTMLHWCNANAGIGYFINDLQRHPLAYFSIKLLTNIFSKSYLVKHDAPVSVLRGFSRNELIDLFKTAGIEYYSINWKWAFRWLIYADIKNPFNE